MLKDADSFEEWHWYIQSELSKEKGVWAIVSGCKLKPPCYISTFLMSPEHEEELASEALDDDAFLQGKGKSVDLINSKLGSMKDGLYNSNKKQTSIIKEYRAQKEWDKEIKRWEDLADVGYGILIGSVSSHLWTLVGKERDPAVIYQMILDCYQSHSSGRVHLLHLKLMTIKMEEGQRLHAYFDKLNNIVDKLEQQNEGITESLHQLLILFGLPVSWEGVKSAINMSDKLTLEKLKSNLLQEEQMCDADGWNCQ